MPFSRSHDGCRIFYRLEGPEGAPVLVLSNSLGTDHMMWQPQTKRLKSQFRILRYDQRGHGASDVPGHVYTLEQLGKDVLSLADSLGIETFSFCGISMGGLTGQWLGVNAPDRLDKLILADTSAHFPPPSMWDERMTAIRTGGMAAISEAVLGRFFSQRFHAACPGIIAQFRNVLEHMDPDGYLGCCEALKTADLRDRIADIDKPTLVISGKHDQSTPPERGEFITQRIAGARHVVFDAAHLSNVEQAVPFTSALLYHLGVVTEAG